MKKAVLAMACLVVSGSALATKCDNVNFQSGKVIVVNSSSGLGTRIELPSPLANPPMVTNSSRWDVIGDVGTKHIMVSPVNNKKGGETTMIFAFTEDGKAFDIRADRVLTSKKNDSCVIIQSRSKMARAITLPPQQLSKPVVYDVSLAAAKAKKDYQSHLSKTAAQSKKAIPQSPKSQSLNEAKPNTPSKKTLTSKTAYKEINPYRTVKIGSFKQNMERLVKNNGYKHVMWDSAVSNCEWRQETSYSIPVTMSETAEEAIAFYARTQDFFPLFSSIDKHVFLSYQGNPSNLTLCSKD